MPALLYVLAYKMLEIELKQSKAKQSIMGNYNHLCGWVKNEREADRIVSRFPQPVFGSTFKDEGKGQDCFLWMAEQQLTGKLRPPHFQKIPDCVTHAFAGAIDDLRFIRISQNINEEFIETATEPIYGGARVQVGKKQLSGQPGCVGAWALQWLLEDGITPRTFENYIDLTTYNPKLAELWGEEGSPITSTKYLLKTASKITSYEQAREAIAIAKCPIVICSDRAFNLTRDTQGFCVLNDADSWLHSIFFDGVSDNPIRPGIVYNQSWGPDVPSGPKNIVLPHNVPLLMPDGKFFIDAEVFDQMIQPKHAGEAYVISDMIGYHRKEDFQFAFC